MQLAASAYIYPPRTKNSTPFPEALKLREYGYKSQFKFNDSHIVLTCIGGEYKLWSRHADLIKNYEVSPELRQEISSVLDRLGLYRTGHHRFDGGLLQFKHTAIRHTLVLWDILVAGGEYRTGSMYGSRFADLQKIADPERPRFFANPDYRLQVGQQITPNIFIPIWVEDWEAAWAGLVELNKGYEQPLIEGLVMKDPQGLLEVAFSESNKCPWMAKTRVATRRHLF